MTSVIFDLDGTLIDSAPDIAANANTVLAEVGLNLLPNEQIASFIGKGVGHLIARLLEASGQAPDGPLFPPMLARFNQRYLTAFDLTTLYPGVMAALEALRAEDYALGICTNKPIAPTHAVLRHLDLARHFGAVLGGDSLPQRKPDPAPLFKTAELLGRDRVMYVGDSETDAATAQNAGVPFLLFTEGYRKAGVDELPHAGVFNDFAQLPALVAGLRGQ